MKNYLKLVGLLITLLCFSTEYLKGQDCRVKRDSIVAGSNDVGVYTDYIYDGLDRLIQTITRDDFSEHMYRVTTIDAASGLVAMIRSVDANDTSRYVDLNYVINQGRVTRVNAYGQNGTGMGVWTMSHDVFYSGGNISNIILDNGSVTGTPEGFQASFIDLVWQNGNATSLSLVAGSDTLKVNATYDDKNNILKKLLNTEGATGLFQANCSNNLLAVITAESGSFMGNNIPMGTKLVERQFTYNNNSDVVTRQEIPAALSNEDRTTKYAYTCNSSIRSLDAVKQVSIYPNPAGGFISIENGNFSGTLKIYDVQGREIKKIGPVQNLSAIEVSDLFPGIYHIEIHNDQKIFQGTFIKN